MQNSHTQYLYDVNSNVSKSVSVENGTVVQFFHNSNGTLSGYLDANGNHTCTPTGQSTQATACLAYTYASGSQPYLQQVQVTNPSGLGNQTFTLDQGGRTTRMVDGKLQTTNSVYDNLDRVKQISYADGAAVAYNYDGDGNLTSMQDASGTTTFAYVDARNRMTQKVLPGTSGTYTYTFNGASVKTVRDSLGGGTVAYGYDVNEQLSSVQENNDPAIQVSYNDNHELGSLTFPNSVTESFAYDDSQRLKQLSATYQSSGGGPTTLTSLCYSYSSDFSANPVCPGSGNDTGTRHGMKDLVAGTSTAFTLDVFNRLLESRTTGGSAPDFRYSYDPNGNLMGLSGAGILNSYFHNGSNQLCWSQASTATAGGWGTTCPTSAPSGATTYLYDPNGNMQTSSSGWGFANNAANQTTGVTAPGQGACVMTYTGATQTERIGRCGTSFGYDLLGLANSLGSDNTFFTRDDRGMSLAERHPGSSKKYFYLVDGLGSVIGLSDSGNGASLAATYRYDPHGNVTPGFSTTGQLRFTGGPLDPSGLDKFGQRYYSPNLATWTQPDSVPAVNSYRYAADDPVNLTDSTGRDVNWGCIAGTAIGLVTGVGITVGLAIMGFGIGFALLGETGPGAVIGGAVAAVIGFGIGLYFMDFIVKTGQRMFC